MNLEFFSGMAKELLLRDGRVELPGLGWLYYLTSPASVSDRGFTINPPYKRLVFGTKLPEEFAPLSNGGDNVPVIVRMYAEANGLPLLAASDTIGGLVESIPSLVSSSRDFPVPGLGRFKRMRDGTLFFVQDQDAELCPAFDMLTAVSLKSHVTSPVPASSPVATEENPVTEEGSVAEEENPVAEDKGVGPEVVATEENPVTEEGSVTEDKGVGPEVVATEENPVTEEGSVAEEENPVTEGKGVGSEVVATEENPVTTEEGSVAEEENPVTEEGSVTEEENHVTEESAVIEEERAKTDTLTIVLVSLLSLLLLVILFLSLVAAIGHFSPETIDPLLYTDEQLDILHRKL